MKFISINNKNLIIDDLVFKYTKKVRIMDNDYEVCALSEKDSLKILYNSSNITTSILIITHSTFLIYAYLKPQ